MTDGVQGRLQHGRGHEVRVREKLREYGWYVQDWGQGLLDDEIRLSLYHPAAEWKVWWRWIPDLIATKNQRAVLVDPKSDLRGTTANFSIEAQAWHAHKLMLSLGLPIVYVWADFTCNTPLGLRPVHFIQGSRIGPGRTDLYLVSKADQIPFGKFFNAPMKKAV